MAYVPISNTLTNDTARIVDRARAAEINSLNLAKAEAAVAASPEVRAELETALWGDYIDLRERLDNLCTPTRVYVTLGNIPGTESTSAGSVGLESVRVPVVCKPGPYSYHAPEDICARIRDIGVVQELLLVKAAEYEAANRWEKVSKDLNKFLNSCKSLNEAIKLYPDIRRYIEPVYLKRLDAKAPVAQAKESAALAALKLLDLDNIQASTVLARMAGNNG